MMLTAVRKHTDCPWVLLYVERWLKASVQMEDGSIVPNYILRVLYDHIDAMDTARDKSRK